MSDTPTMREQNDRLERLAERLEAISQELKATRRERPRFDREPRPE